MVTPTTQAVEIAKSELAKEREAENLSEPKRQNVVHKRIVTRKRKTAVHKGKSAPGKKLTKKGEVSFKKK